MRTTSVRRFLLDRGHLVWVLPLVGCVVFVLLASAMNEQACSDPTVAAANADPCERVNR